jgi:hypothetical protein
MSLGGGHLRLPAASGVRLSSPRIAESCRGCRCPAFVLLSGALGGDRLREGDGALVAVLVHGAQPELDVVLGDV